MIDIGQFFPDRLKQNWLDNSDKWKYITQIRLRTEKKVLLELINGESELKDKNGTSVIYSGKDIEDIFRHLCRDSVYAYERERMQGFITVEGGHRIGIAGELVQNENGSIIKNIRYMNIRIAREITGVSNKIMEEICTYSAPNNTLIISPPGVGKTTVLRDIIRNLSNQGYTVGVIDERGEIAAAYRGGASFDCGSHTDVITGGNKTLGVQILVRTFSPRVIAMDEIGVQKDADVILYARVSGCSVIATAHGNGLDDVMFNPNIKELIERKCFDRFVVLSMQGIKRMAVIYDREGKRVCGVEL